MNSLVQRCKSVVKSVIPPSLVRWTLPAKADRSVLLTFDDGPDVEVTAAVLDVLKENEARAVFFVVGTAITAETEHVLRRIVSEGHALGNHSFTHSPEDGGSIEYYKSELKDCQKRIADACGVAPVLFRPPRGALSFSALMAARSLGLKVVLWSQGGGEFDEMKGCTPLQISERLARLLRGGDIVLLHDTLPEIPAALDTLLPTLRASGIDLGRGIDTLTG